MVGPAGDLGTETGAGLGLGGTGLEISQPGLGLHDKTIRFNRRCPSHKCHLPIKADTGGKVSGLSDF